MNLYMAFLNLAGAPTTYRGAWNDQFVRDFTAASGIKGWQGSPLRGFTTLSLPCRYLEKPFEEGALRTADGFRYRRGFPYRDGLHGLAGRLIWHRMPEAQMAEMFLCTFAPEKEALRWYRTQLAEGAREVVHTRREVERGGDLLELSKHLDQGFVGPLEFLNWVWRQRQNDRHLGLVYDSHHWQYDLDAWLQSCPDLLTRVAPDVELIHFQIRQKEDLEQLLADDRNVWFRWGLAELFAAGCTASDVVIEIGWASILGPRRAFCVSTKELARRNLEVVKATRRLFDSLGR